MVPTVSGVDAAAPPFHTGSPDPAGREWKDAVRALDMAPADHATKQREREAAAVRQRAAQIQRETDRSLRSAHKRTRSAVNAVLAEQRHSGAAALSIVPRAWARAPTSLTNAALATADSTGWSVRPGSGASAPLGGTQDPRHSTFHFRLGETHHPSVAHAHQSYIEREEACVASFGTIADTQAERERVWDAMGERVRRNNGTLRLDFKDAPQLATHVLESLAEWTEDGLLNAGAARAVAARARAVIQDQADAERPEVEDPSTPDTDIGTTTEADVTRHTARSRKRALKKESQTSLTFWTPDLETHRELLKQITAWVPEAERKTRIKSHQPRQTIIQRRIVMELAHELDDDARERCTQQWCARNLGGHGVAWHAAIHAPENNNDERNYHAHIVYTQFALEREEDRPRWTFEDSETLPTPAQVIKTLSGNGPEKRKGSAALIKTWRADWAEIQNREFATIAALKRYDHRSYRDQGRGHIVPGKHRGTVQSTIEERGGVATPSAHSTDAEWDRLAAMLAAHLGVEQDPDPPERTNWTQCLPEPVRDAFEALRLHTGLSEDYEEIANLITERIDEASKEDHPIPDEHPHAQAATWLRAIRKEPARLLELEDPPELENWQQIERTVLDASERSRRALQIVDAWDDDTRRRTQSDPRPPVRRLHASARRAKTIRERWTDHLTKLHASVKPAMLEEEQIDALLRQLDESGVSVISAFRREGARHLATERNIAHTEDGLRELTEAIVNGHDNDLCKRRVRRLKTVHRRMAPHLSDKEDESFRNRFELLEAAIDVRAQFKNATGSATPRLLTATAHALAKPIEQDPRRQRIHQAAIAMLRRSERSEIARATRDSAAVLVTHQANRRLIAKALNRLGTEQERLNDPARVDALAADNALLNELRRVSPSDGHTVDRGIYELAKRRYAMTSACQKATGLAKANKKTDAEGLGRLKPADAAELYGTDPGLFRLDHLDLYHEITPRLIEYSRVTRRAITRINAQYPERDDAAYHIATLCTPAQHRALQAQRAPAAAIISQAVEREKLARRYTLLQIRQLTESLTRQTVSPARTGESPEGTPATKLDQVPRPERIRQLHALIAHPRTATRLTRRELRLAARRAGAFGAPRSPQPDMAPTPQRAAAESEI